MKGYNINSHCKHCPHKNDAHDMNCIECCPVSKLIKAEKQRDKLASMLARYARITNRAKAMHTKEFWLKQAEIANTGALVPTISCANAE